MRLGVNTVHVLEKDDIKKKDEIFHNLNIVLLLIQLHTAL